MSGDQLEILLGVYFLNDDKKNETQILINMKIQASSDNYKKLSLTK